MAWPYTPEIPFRDARHDAAAITTRPIRLRPDGDDPRQHERQQVAHDRAHDRGMTGRSGGKCPRPHDTPCGSHPCRQDTDIPNPRGSEFVEDEILIKHTICRIGRAGVAAPVLPCVDQGKSPFFMGIAGRFRGAIGFRFHDPDTSDYGLQQCGHRFHSSPPMGVV